MLICLNEIQFHSMFLIRMMNAEKGIFSVSTIICAVLILVISTFGRVYREPLSSGLNFKMTIQTKSTLL